MCYVVVFVVLVTPPLRFQFAVHSVLAVAAQGFLSSWHDICGFTHTRAVRSGSARAASTVAMDAGPTTGASAYNGHGAGGAGAGVCVGAENAMSLAAWDTAAYASLLDAQARAASAVLRSCCFSPNADYLSAVSSFGMLHTWELDTVGR